MALTKLQVDKIKKPGRYGDGGGLWLQVSSFGTKAWLYRFTLRGRARQMGLGPVEDVSLADARDLAHAARLDVRAGRDPIELRKAVRSQQAAAAASSMTFREAALAAIVAREPGWDNQSHLHQWRRTLETYAYPTLGSLSVASIDTGLVLKCLEPIWNTKRTTAERLRGRIEAVLDWAAARGSRTGENPARWKGHLQHLLSGTAPAVEHLAALPYQDVPEFLQRLRTRGGITAKALEFTILTGTRTGESIGAHWPEIEGDTWTIPATRMKGTKGKRREHRVPLSYGAKQVLSELPRLGEFVFPGAREGQPLHRKAMNDLLTGMGIDATVHGFRSSFKDWASECTAYPNEVSEMALAHVIPSKVEASYRRGDLFEKRRRLMEDWSRFCAAPKQVQGGVVPIRRSW